MKSTWRSCQRRLDQRQLAGTGVQLSEHAERHGDRVVAVAEPEVGDDRHAEVAEDVGDDGLGWPAIGPRPEDDAGGAVKPPDRRRWVTYESIR